MYVLRSIRKLVPVVVGLCLVTAGSSALAQVVAGRVMVATGNVRAIDLKGKERKLEKGSEVRTGERIVTDEGALAQVLMKDGGYLSVRSATEMSIDAFVHDEKESSKSSFVVSLLKGGFRSITGMIGKSNPDGYRINAATATIGVRGTDHEPMLVLPPVGNLPVINPPGVYDKVNSGETFIRNEFGTLNIKAGQVGFTAIRPDVAPQISVKIPDFYKLNANIEGRDAGKNRGGKDDDASRSGKDKQSLRPGAEPVKEAGSAILRPMGTSTGSLRPALIEPVEGSKLEPVRTDATLTPTVISPTTTTSTSTLIAPTTTLVSPTTTSTTTLIAPTTSLQSTTTIQPTTTTTTTIQPTSTTTTIQPTSSTTTILR